MIKSLSGQVVNTSSGRDAKAEGEFASLLPRTSKLMRRYYFNNDRQFVQNNQPGDLWYCMPAAAAVTMMHEDPDVLTPQPDEGCFSNQWIGEQEVHPMSLTILVSQHERCIADRDRPTCGLQSYGPVTSRNASGLARVFGTITSLGSTRDITIRLFKLSQVASHMRSRSTSGLIL